ncbi:secreted RxLR effector protein 161-like [Aristolochia californica]|uniref:secreted RxLR effector protein 161-like n=1 Tax=Aristolochia californica TaxID=171875 RepID=UPI0035DBC87C
MTTVRTILAIAASQSWPLHQMDVKNAFLHSDLQEDVYIKLPSGLSKPPWLSLRSFATHKFSTSLHRLQKVLHAIFHMKDLGQLTYFLGLEVSQFMSSPRHLHFAVVRHIISYLCCSPVRGLFFPIGSVLRLVAYSDADWAGCPDTRCSTTGWCIFLGDTLISLKCKKQDRVSRSSTEAEYSTMPTVCSEVIWLCGLLAELQFL